MSGQSALKEAIKRAGGQEALAEAIGVPQSTISYWLRGSKKGVPAEKVADIERVTLVPRHKLRPDLFPSLQNSAGPPPQAVTKEPDPSRREGHFTRFKNLRRAHFKSADEINEHIRALRDEWERR